jgi:Ca-activated chloride channel family protein
MTDLSDRFVGLELGYKDHQMEELSNAGNGNYFYQYSRSKKGFNTQMRATLLMIAKDVKIKLNLTCKSSSVSSFDRLQENRRLQKKILTMTKKKMLENWVQDTL